MKKLLLKANSRSLVLLVAGIFCCSIAVKAQAPSAKPIPATTGSKAAHKVHKKKKKKHASVTHPSENDQKLKEIKAEKNKEKRP